MRMQGIWAIVQQKGSEGWGAPNLLLSSTAAVTNFGLRPLKPKPGLWGTAGARPCLSPQQLSGVGGGPY
jgi:hypothetical protein